MDILIEEIDGSIWVAALDSTRVVGESPIAESGAIDRPPGMAAAPELGVVAMCFGVRSTDEARPPGSESHVQTAFMLLDRDARVVAEAARIGARVKSFGGCDLAWSGREFLLAHRYLGPPLSADVTEEQVSQIVVQSIRVSAKPAR